MKNYRLTRHAQEELVRRAIPRDLLDQTLNAPQQIVPADGGKVAYQSQLKFGGDTLFLLRVIVDDSVDPAAVVTLYRTAKIDKYWSKSP